MKSTPSSPSTQPRKARKPQRFVRLNGDSLTIRQVFSAKRETVDVYAVKEVGTDDETSRGFSFTKQDGTVYHVECSPTHRACDCLGGLQHSNCKHADSVAALLSRGQLGGYPEPRREPEYTDAEIDAMASDFGYVGDAA
jgi:hypothetical protein